MTATTRSNRTPTLVGAGIGLVAFLAVGLLPTLVYGGYAGVILAAGLSGAPVGPALGVKLLIGLGMVLGVLAVAALFTVGGAVVGAAVGALTRGAAGDEAEPSSRGF
jgi:hypothetical protein